jgi:hypothetical protein
VYECKPLPGLRNGFLHAGLRRTSSRPRRNAWTEERLCSGARAPGRVAACGVPFAGDSSG